MFDLTPSSKPAVIHVDKDEPLYILVANLSVADRGDVGVVVGTSDTEVYYLTLHFDDESSTCAQQAASGFANIYVYLDRKKGAATVSYHSQADDPSWEQDAEHTVSIDGTGKIVNEALNGNFSGTDSLSGGNGGSMNIEATFDFAPNPDTPDYWSGTVKGSAAVKIPAHDGGPGLDCTATLGTKTETLWPSDK